MCLQSKNRIQLQNLCLYFKCFWQCSELQVPESTVKINYMWESIRTVFIHTQTSRLYLFVCFKLSVWAQEHTKKISILRKSNRMEKHLVTQYVLSKNGKTLLNNFDTSLLLYFLYICIYTHIYRQNHLLAYFL